MQFGAPREIVIPMKIPPGEAPYLEAVITFQRGGKDQNVSITGADRMSNEHSIFAYYRSMAITQALNYYNATRRARMRANSKAFDAFSKELHTIACTAGFGSNFKTLSGDFAGRLTKSFEGKDRFNRWGRHYILCLTRSWQLMQ